MAQLPPQGWDELATKADVALLRGDLAMLEQRLQSQISGDIHSLRTELKGDIVGLAREVSALRAEMHRSQKQLTLTLVAVMTGLVGVLGVLDRITG